MVPVRYFNGRDASAFDGHLNLEAGRVVVRGVGVERNEPFDSVEFSERIGNTPRFVRFSDGTFCEVADVQALDRLLAASNVAPSAISQWEGSGRLVGILVVALVVLAVLTYRYGLPLGARVLAHRLPVSTLDILSDQTLALLDSQVFDPTELPETRRNSIAAKFAALRLPTTSDIPMEVTFRKAPELGANALALPSGDIIVTDELVALANTDDEVVGVLAHEAGHVQERHGLRNIIQSSAVAFLVAAFLGDVGSLVAVAPTALLQAKYSRDLERDADGYALNTMRANGMSPHPLADILERMEASHGGGASGPIAYVSTHPATTDRIAMFRK